MHIYIYNSVASYSNGKLPQLHYITVSLFRPHCCDTQVVKITIGLN